MAKTAERKIKTVSNIEHILLRPSMYIGGVTNQNHDSWIFNKNNELKYTTVTYPEGLLKIINEAIDNSVDEHIKTNGKYATKVNVTISNDTFSVTDNGRGIPTSKNKDGQYQAYVATCIPMSGDNFDDDKNRKSIGMNGIGIKALSIYSKQFECITCDGKAKLKIIAKDNLSKTDVKKLTKSSKTGTSITAKPDFSRFNVKGFSNDIITMIRSRLLFLSWFNPKCTFTLNGEQLKITAKQLGNALSDNAVILDEDNVYCCVYPTDEPYVLSYVNGLNIKKGGSHVNYVSNKIVDQIREKVSKKFKNIKPADIRNRLSIVLFMKDFPNLQFDSQTKEQVTNSQADLTEYFEENEIDFDAFTTKILKNKEILDNITEMYRLKEELAEKKELAKLTKTKKEVESKKYYPPIGKTAKKYLMLTEGESAFGGLSKILGRDSIGYYQLRGKVMNILNEKPSKYMKNTEILELFQILGLNQEGEMNYEKVIVASDQDMDGIAIAGLVITMFSVLSPEMLKQKRICRLNTPLLIGKKGNKVVDYYFTFPKKTDLKPNIEYNYLKGLGSWNKKDLDQVIEMEGGLDNLLLPFKFDKKATESIDNWYGDDSEPRKDFLRGREFHIDKA